MKKLRSDTILWMIVILISLYPRSLIYLYNILILHPHIKDILICMILYVLLIRYYLFLCKIKNKYK